MRNLFGFNIVLLFLLGLNVGCSTYGFHSQVIDSTANMSIVEHRSTRFGIAQRDRYLKDKGRSRQLTIHDIDRFINKKYHGQNLSLQKAIQEFVSLHNPWDTIILKSAEDIPDFDRNQLDPDFRDMSFSPIEYIEDDDKYMIIYTWTVVGGVLKRYKFRLYSDNFIDCKSCIELQDGIGKYSSLI
jgi:hypothetical protein